MLLSSIMDMDDYGQSKSDEAGLALAGTAGSGEGSPAGDGAAAAPPGKGKVGPVRRLLRNLACGCRLALLLRVSPDRFLATPGALALIAATDFLLNLAVSFLLVGRGGSFAYSAVPGFFFHLPLLLFLGYLAGRIYSRERLTVSIPVALVSLSIPIELCHSLLERLSLLPRFAWLEDYLNAPHYYRFFWWWSAAALLFLWRLRPGGGGRRLALALCFTGLLVVPLCYFPRADLWVSAAESGESGELHLTEEVLSAQARLLDGELAGLLPGRRGVADLYFVGLAGDATQDVFLKELTAAEKLFSERFGTQARSVLLANNPQTASTLPFATAGNLERTLAGVGRVMNRDEDVLFLYLTSHGSRDHELALNNQPLELDGLAPEAVARMLKRSGIAWKVVVVSACYAGGFIEPLKDDGTLIITAADASHESFGCGFGEKFTWFGEAFLDDALRRTFSFTGAFEMARDTIGGWEKEQGETPSNPQIWVGKGIAARLLVLEERLKARDRRLEEPQ